MFVLEGFLKGRTVYVGKPFVKTDVIWVHDIAVAKMFETAEEALAARFLILTREIDIEEITVKPRAYSVDDIINSGPFLYVVEILSKEFNGQVLNSISAHQLLYKFKELGKDFFKQSFLDEIGIRYDREVANVTWVIPAYELYKDDPFISRIH